MRKSISRYANPRCREQGRREQAALDPFVPPGAGL